MMANSSFIENPEYLKYRRIFDDCLEYVTVEGTVCNADGSSFPSFSAGGKSTVGMRDTIYFFLKTPLSERLSKYRTTSPHFYISQVFGNRILVKNALAFVEKNGNQTLSIRISVEGSVFNRFHVCERDKVAYLDIPKCASSSFRESQRFAERILSPEEIKAEGYKTIAIVRNPIRRIVSGFLEIRKRRNLPHVFKYYDQPVYDEIFANYLTIEQSFLKMIEALLEGRIKDTHVVKQSQMLQNRLGEGKLPIEKFYKLENIQKAIDENAGVGSYFAMKNLNKTEDLLAKGNLISFVDKIEESLRERLMEYLKEDFEIYNSAV